MSLRRVVSCLVIIQSDLLFAEEEAIAGNYNDQEQRWEEEEEQIAQKYNDQGEKSEEEDSESEASEASTPLLQETFYSDKSLSDPNHIDAEDVAGEFSDVRAGPETSEKDTSSQDQDPCATDELHEETINAVSDCFEEDALSGRLEDIEPSEKSLHLTDSREDAELPVADELHTSGAERAERLEAHIQSSRVPSAGLEDTIQSRMPRSSEVADASKSISVREEETLTTSLKRCVVAAPMGDPHSSGSSSSSDPEEGELTDQSEGLEDHIRNRLAGDEHDGAEGDEPGMLSDAFPVAEVSEREEGEITDLSAGEDLAVDHPPAVHQEADDHFGTFGQTTLGVGHVEGPFTTTLFPTLTQPSTQDAAARDAETAAQRSALMRTLFLSQSASQALAPSPIPEPTTRDATAELFGYRAEMTAPTPTSRPGSERLSRREARRAPIKETFNPSQDHLGRRPAIGGSSVHSIIPKQNEQADLVPRLCRRAVPQEADALLVVIGGADETTPAPQLETQLAADLSAVPNQTEALGNLKDVMIQEPLETAKRPVTSLSAEVGEAAASTIGGSGVEARESAESAAFPAMQMESADASRGPDTVLGDDTIAQPDNIPAASSSIDLEGIKTIEVVKKVKRDGQPAVAARTSILAQYMPSASGSEPHHSAMAPSSIFGQAPRVLQKGFVVADPLRGLLSPRFSAVAPLGVASDRTSFYKRSPGSADPSREQKSRITNQARLSGDFPPLTDSAPLMPSEGRLTHSITSPRADGTNDPSHSPGDATSADQSQPPSKEEVPHSVRLSGIDKPTTDPVGASPLFQLPKAHTEPSASTGIFGYAVPSSTQSAIFGASSGTGTPASSSMFGSAATLSFKGSRKGRRAWAASPGKANSADATGEAGAGANLFASRETAKPASTRDDISSTFTPAAPPFSQHTSSEGPTISEATLPAHLSEGIPRPSGTADAAFHTGQSTQSLFGNAVPAPKITPSDSQAGNIFSGRLFGNHQSDQGDHGATDTIGSGRSGLFAPFQSAGEGTSGTSKPPENAGGLFGRSRPAPQGEEASDTQPSAQSGLFGPEAGGFATGSLFGRAQPGLGENATGPDSTRSLFGARAPVVPDSKSAGAKEGDIREDKADAHPTSSAGGETNRLFGSGSLFGSRSAGEQAPSAVPTKTNIFADTPTSRVGSLFGSGSNTLFGQTRTAAGAGAQAKDASGRAEAQKASGNIFSKNLGKPLFGRSSHPPSSESQNTAPPTDRGGSSQEGQSARPVHFAASSSTANGRPSGAGDPFGRKFQVGGSESRAPPSSNFPAGATPFGDDSSALPRARQKNKEESEKNDSRWNFPQTSSRPGAQRAPETPPSRASGGFGAYKTSHSGTFGEGSGCFRPPNLRPAGSRGPSAGGGRMFGAAPASRYGSRETSSNRAPFYAMDDSGYGSPQGYDMDLDSPQYGMSPAEPAEDI